MSKLEKLIQQYCPDGVEYSLLENITSAVNIGINPRNFFKLNPDNATGFYVTVRELNGLQGVLQHKKTDVINDEAISIINERAKIEKGDILFSNTGTVGKMALVHEKPKDWGVNEGIYVIKPISNLINSRFLYYFLSGNEAYNQYSKKFTGSTLKHVTQKALLSIHIPVPPLPVQEEIVKILDSFTQLTAELQAELQARKKQYDYYLNEIYRKNSEYKGIESFSLNQLCDVITKQTGFDYSATIKPSLTKEYSKEVLSFIQNKDFSGMHINFDTDFYIPKETANLFPKIMLDRPSVLISLSGKVGNVGFYCDEKKAFIGGAVGICKLKRDVNGKYILYYLQSKQGQKYLLKSVKAGSHLNITVESIRNAKIPIPPVHVQEEIVSKLERFETLCNDLSSGLPAEIEARQKQYEYYRDKLLDFKPLA